MFVYYNGITFDIVKTNEHSMEAIYTDDGVDYLMTKVHIDVEGQMNPAAMAYRTIDGIAIPFAGTLPGVTIAAVRKTLLESRGVLQVTDHDAQVVISSPADGFTTDAKNGPHPSYCQVRQIFGSRTWTLRWVCDVYIIECPMGDPMAIVSNRWSDESHVNSFQMTTRVTSGKMVFRSDVLLQAGQVAHGMFDGTSIPPVAPGFRRTNLDVVVESSGLALQWRTTDQELVYDLGETDPREGASGILKIEGSYGVSSIAAGDGPPGAMSMVQINIRAYGSKIANQWIMLQRCLDIALTKVAVGNKVAGFLRHVAMRESMGDDSKWVEVILAFQQSIQGSTGKPGAGNIRLDGLRKDVSEVFEDHDGAQPGLLNGDGTRGTAIITLMTQALQDACAEVSEPEPLQATGTGGMGPPTGPPPAITVTPVDEFPDRTDLYNGDPEQEDYPYTRYKGSLEYETYGGTIQTPTTGPPPQQPSGGGSGGTGTMAPTGGSPTGPPGSGSTGFGGTGTPGIGFSAPVRQSGPGSAAWSWPCSTFQISSPMAKMRIEFQAERVGLPPLVPTLTPNNDNLILTQSVIRPEMPIVWIDGNSIIYSVSGFYEFIMKKAQQPGESLAMGILPWTSISFEDSQLTPDDFVSGIYDNPHGSTGGSTGSIGTST